MNRVVLKEVALRSDRFSGLAETVRRGLFGLFLLQFALVWARLWLPICQSGLRTKSAVVDSDVLTSARVRFVWTLDSASFAIAQRARNVAVSSQRSSSQPATLGG